jgi:hypothetical protein
MVSPKKRKILEHILEVLSPYREAANFFYQRLEEEYFDDSLKPRPDERGCIPIELIAVDDLPTWARLKNLDHETQLKLWYKFKCVSEMVYETTFWARYLYQREKEKNDFIPDLDPPPLGFTTPSEEDFSLKIQTIHSEALKKSMTKDLSDLANSDLSQIREGILYFMFFWSAPIKKSLKLVKATSRIITPDMRQKLAYRFQAIDRTLITVRAFAEGLKADYLNDIREPMTDQNGLQTFKFKLQNLNGEVPYWAELKNLDDQETTLTVWRQIGRIMKKMSGLLDKTRKLYFEVNDKVSSTFHDHLLQSPFKAKREIHRKDKK